MTILLPDTRVSRCEELMKAVLKFAALSAWQRGSASLIPFAADTYHQTLIAFISAKPNNTIYAYVGLLMYYSN